MGRKRESEKRLGFEGLAHKIIREEKRRHPSYSKARLERIGHGAAANVYRQQLAKRA